MVRLEDRWCVGCGSEALRATFFDEAGQEQDLCGACRLSGSRPVQVQPQTTAPVIPPQQTAQPQILETAQPKPAGDGDEVDEQSKVQGG